MQTIRKECNFYDISLKTKRTNTLIDGPTTKKEAERTIHREHVRMRDLNCCREAIYYTVLHFKCWNFRNVGKCSQ